jgi:hypothetical protein
MADELGRIEKPTVESFGSERKLFVVPLLFQYSDAPAEYLEKLSLYWEQVREHVARMEEKVGRVDRIYHETVFVGGEKGLEILEKISRDSCSLTSEKCRQGARLEALDDQGLMEECMDWERCLMLGFISAKVARMVSDFYAEASRKRYEHMASRIDETLKENERAILFIREGHSLQFPKETQVFSVYPPALDLIHRWMRDRASAEVGQDEEPPHPEEPA